ncbi:ABC transporter permease [Candidatus Aerophobetes bacterium]|nr:ABC transporter permease [Candidatus Aerophobetes bacterium]
MQKKEVETFSFNLNRLSWSYLSENYPNFGTSMATFLIMLGFVIIFGSLAPAFFTIVTFFNILIRTSIYIILSVGMTLVLTSSGIDISIGSQIGLIGVSLGWAMRANYPVWLSLLLAILVGAICGSFNGFLVSKVQVPPIVTTLGTMTLYRGITYLLAAKELFTGFPATFRWFGQGDLWGLPVPAIISAIVAVGGYLFLYSTKWGQHITAVGGNEESARLTGIKTAHIKFMVYLIMGILTALATIVLLSRTGAGQAAIGEGMELITLTAVVLGGTALFGGKGLILGSVMGSLILSMLGTGLLLSRVHYFWQLVATGALFIIVVTVRSIQEKGEV